MTQAMSRPSVQSASTAVAAASLTQALSSCVESTRHLDHHDRAQADFDALCDRTDAQTAELLNTLWQELLAARRSAAFWQEMCDVEKELSHRIAESNLQLRQNYLRLMEEQ
jgi:hypothetical protein